MADETQNVAPSPHEEQPGVQPPAPENPLEHDPPVQQTESGTVAPAATQQPAVEVRDAEGNVQPGHEGDSQPALDIAFQKHQPREIAAELHGEVPGAVMPRQPVKVDGRNRRNDNDALEGHFVDVVDGDHKGVFGVFEHVTKFGEDAYPKEILVRTRDELSDLITVAYEHVRPSKRSGGR